MKLQRFFSQNPLSDLPSLFASFKNFVPGGAEAKNHDTWFNFRNAKEEDTTEVSIYDYIGAYGVTASDFIAQLNEVETENLHVRINSPGGEVSNGIAIYNAIRRFNGTVSVFVDGMAASAASFIAMAASPGCLFMSPHSEMFIHDGQGLCMGPASDMRKMADLLDATSNNIAGIYAERAGGTVKQWRAFMVDEMLYSDQEAVDAGLADAISGDGKTTTTKTTTEEETDALGDEFDFGAALREQVQSTEEFDFGEALRKALPVSV